MTPANSAGLKHGSGAKTKTARREPLSSVGPVVHWTSGGRSLAHHRYRPAASNQVQPFWQLGVVTHLQRRVAVVGNGITDVGNQTPSRNPNQPIAGPLAQSEGSSELRIDKHPQTGTIGICGAMSLQRGDSGRGNESVPQKLVHLVGCRDPKVRPESWDRPQLVPTKP